MTITDDRGWHYIKPNETTRIPRRHIFLDTESRTERTAGGHVQTWRLAVACFQPWRPGRRNEPRWSEFDTSAELWEAVDAWCGASNRTVLWAHNLSYDVRIAEAFTVLPRAGWILDGHNIAPRGTWLTWHKGRATLTMVDSASVYPTTLAAVGKAFGLAKLDLPAEDDSRGAWLARCRRDVEILRTAVLAYLHWLERDDMGNWQLTGAGQAWATFRHRFMTHKMLVHADSEALAAERRALWTGRCEAYWHGELKGQVVHEWDLSLAYARIAREHPLPVRYLGPMPDGYDWRSTLDNPRVALLAVCRVETDVPCVPTSVDERICWPVGRFPTVLWDVEIREALASGAAVVVDQAWLYRTNPALARWAHWVISSMEAPDEAVPAWQKLIIKHWARALVGRFAMTYQSWEDFASAPDPRIRRETVWDVEAEESYELMQVGNRVWKDTGRQEWAQSMPMITGYIQALCRVRLWRIMQALPKGALLYVDTDSILVTDRWLRAVHDIAGSPVGLGLRLKRSWDGFAIYGPRQIVTGTQIRVAGIPRTATPIGPRQFAGEVWESLATSLRHGDPTRVITRDRVWNVRGVDNRRVGPSLGWTQPIRIPPPV